MRIWLIRHFRTQGNLEDRKYPVLSGEDHHKSNASLQTDS